MVVFFLNGDSFYNFETQFILMIITLQKMAISFLTDMGIKIKRRKLRKEQKPYICPTFIILLY